MRLVERFLAVRPTFQRPTMGSAAAQCSHVTVDGILGSSNMIQRRHDIYSIRADSNSDLLMPGDLTSGYWVDGQSEFGLAVT
jgi:hypothetical protein